MSPLDTLRRLLDTGAQPSYADLTQHLGLSERQIRRLLDRLRGMGLPIRHRHDGPVKRFCLPAEAQRHVVPDLAFDTDEVRALAIAASASRAALGGTPYAAPLQRAFDKLLEQTAPLPLVFDVDAAAHAWHFEEAHFDHIDSDTFRVLLQAIEEAREVEIDYYAAGRDAWTYNRCVRPYCLARRGRALMLVGWCCLRGGLRNFALEGIGRVALTDRYFDPPVNFDVEMYFRDAAGAVNSGEVEEVRLRVEPDRAPYFKRRKYFPTQQESDPDPDGRIEVSFESQGVDTEVLSFVLSWGRGVTVLSPPTLAQKVRDEAASMAAQS